MMDQQNVAQMDVPSLGKIVAATVAALIVACVILVTVVLPAEYGIDPLGTGKALGLGDLARATEPAQATAARRLRPRRARLTSIAPVLEPSVNGEAPRVTGSVHRAAGPIPDRLQGDHARARRRDGDQVQHEERRRPDLLVDGERESRL